ncbi:MAG TPA: hypothetical protein VNE39_19575 [Planctomycetota bacterium]|nr:hypothetical protein [Planctomycetota bacterium]
MVQTIAKCLVTTVAALGVLLGAASDAAADPITNPGDPIYGIWSTTAGGNSTPSSAGTGGGQYPATQSPANAIDATPRST